MEGKTLPDKYVLKYFTSTVVLCIKVDSITLWSGKAAIPSRVSCGPFAVKLRFSCGGGRACNLRIFLVISERYCSANSQETEGIYRAKNTTISFCSDIDDCASNPCVHATNCTDLQQDFSCECKSGWKGKTCNESK